MGNSRHCDFCSAGTVHSRALPCNAGNREAPVGAPRNGLQFYYIAADGSTASGPHFPCFSELAEMYPSGDRVSLLSASNPLTGKHVNVDYLPNEVKIRVSTFYPGSEYDTDKPYIFNFGSEYSINVEAW